MESSSSMFASANSTLLELIGPSSPASTPFYFVASRPSLLPGISDRYLSVAIPVVIYWVLGGLFFWLDKMEFPYFEARRIHEPQVCLPLSLSFQSSFVGRQAQRVLVGWLGRRLMVDG
jgi:hypothetical protein